MISNDLLTFIAALLLIKKGQTPAGGIFYNLNLNVLWLVADL